MSPVTRCHVTAFTGHSLVERLNTNRDIMDPKSIRQCKADQARILEQFNTPYYGILVCLELAE